MKRLLLPPLFKLFSKSTFLSSLNQNTCPVLDAEEIKKTKKEYGPFINKNEAESLAKSLIQKNIDDFYHRAWVINKN